MSATPDTIAAIATPTGRSAIGVVRVSGSNLSAFIAGLIGRGLRPRTATRASFLDAARKGIDEGLALYFPAPHSYTGEDILELQGHGGPTVLRLLLQRCLELGARVAEPGEFTRRAFLNGKLDLAQAESVIDLIDASTAEAARSALRSLRGEFSARIGALGAQLTELRVRVEAGLDFPEEQIDPEDRNANANSLDQLRGELNAIRLAARQGRLLRDGLQVVLAGEPNVGKSSLLNRLAGEERAIVTDVPGTTRDLIREVIALEGMPIHLVDTAGLRDSNDPVERLGVERAWTAIRDADAVIALYDVTHSQNPERDDPLAGVSLGVPCVRVMNKIDLLGHGPHIETVVSDTTIWLSAKTGEGVDLLRTELRRIAGWEGHGETVFLARERHLRALRAASGHLATAADALDQAEIFAEELRLTHEALATITGEFTPDDLLGEIFSRFCIGK